jgi:hypothetical protein
MTQSEWPVEQRRIVRILDEEETATHIFQYRADGVIAIGFTNQFDEASGKSMLKPGETLVPRNVRQALRTLLDRADAIDQAS